MRLECINGSVLIDAADLPLVEGYGWRLIKGYARCGSGRRGETRAMHRFIVGAAAGDVVDHINGDPTDNRRSNLRICTAQENARNRKPHSGREFKGVTARLGRFRACILVNGKQVSLGGYETAIEAALAYDRAAAVHHGEFARLNFDPARDWLFPYPPVDVEARIIRRGL
jgi:hypothetical protein